MRAYTPRRATLDLRRAIADLDDVAKVVIISPRRAIGNLPARGARLRVAYSDGSYDDMTLAEARRYLAFRLAAAERGRLRAGGGS